MIVPTIAPGLALSQQQICECFNRLFGQTHRVRLEGGGAEPDYLPANSGQPALIIAREDFAASALHEAAHWCVASRRRRQLPDYGYVYVAPPRGQAGQRSFFASEMRVQAVECYLSSPAGLRFRASADDPDYCLQALERFQNQLRELVDRWDDESQSEAAPPRAVQLADALHKLRSALLVGCAL